MYGREEEEGRWGESQGLTEEKRDEQGGKQLIHCIQLRLQSHSLLLYCSLQKNLKVVFQFNSLTLSDSSLQIPSVSVMFV